MAAGATDVVRAFEFAAVRAFVRIGSDQSIVGAAHVAAGPRDSVLRDSHVSTSGLAGHGPCVSGVQTRGGHSRAGCEPCVQARPGTYCDSDRAQVFSGSATRSHSSVLSRPRIRSASPAKGRNSASSIGGTSGAVTSVPAKDAPGARG